MPKTYPIKLVRDNIESAVGGGTITYEDCPPGDHVRLLRRKLIEESLEYLENPCIEELADVLEVVNSLAIVDLGTEFGRIERERWDKQRQRGGFNNGVLMSVTKE